MALGPSLIANGKPVTDPELLFNIVHTFLGIKLAKLNLLSKNLRNTSGIAGYMSTTCLYMLPNHGSKLPDKPLVKTYENIALKRHAEPRPASRPSRELPPRTELNNAPPGSCRRTSSRSFRSFPQSGSNEPTCAPPTAPISSWGAAISSCAERCGAMRSDAEIGRDGSNCGQSRTVPAPSEVHRASRTVSAPATGALGHVGSRWVEGLDQSFGAPEAFTSIFHLCGTAKPCAAWFRLRIRGYLVQVKFKCILC